MNVNELNGFRERRYGMEFFDMPNAVAPAGAVHCPNGGVCNAGSGCAPTSHPEIDNNDANLQFNSGNS